MRPSELTTLGSITPPVIPAGLTARAETLVVRVLETAFVVGAAIVCVRPLMSSTPWPVFLTDDFFYYLKVAENIAAGHGSTFNGIVQTNGYHPLWLLILTAFSSVSPSSRYVLPFVCAVVFLSTISTFLISRRIILRSGIPLLGSTALGIYVAAYAMDVMFGGMEVVLAIPLALALLARLHHPDLWLRSRNFFVIGLMASLMILSRIDTIILAGLIVASVAASPSLRAGIGVKHIGALALGLSPVLVYFLVNLHVFHALLPVSAAAKQLKTSLLPSAVPWRSIFAVPSTQLVKMLVPIVGGIPLAFLLRRRFTAMQFATILPTLVFPFAYVAVLSWRSDWGLWMWYFYPFSISLCVGLLVFCSIPVIRRTSANPLIVAALVLIAAKSFLATSWRPVNPDLYAAALDIRNFAASHPGVYAMGDRSGTPGYLIPDPFIQTEGLVMDKAFLSHIESEDDLRAVLAEYHVKYYVGTSYKDPVRATSCFHAREPFQAGPESPHMQADFCEAPAASFEHGPVHTMIYDLEAAASRPSTN